MATPTLTAEIKLKGGPEATAQVKAFGDAASAAFAKAGAASAALAANGFGVKLSAGIAAAKAQFATVAAAGVEFSKAFRETNRAVNEVGTAFVTVGRRAAEFVAVVGALQFGLGKLAKSGVEAADNIGDLAKATGLSTEEFQKLQFAASTKGIGTDQLVQGIIRFEKVLQGLPAAAGPASEAIKAFTVPLTADRADAAATGIVHVTDAMKQSAGAAKDLAKAQGEANISLGDGETISLKAANALKELGLAASGNVNTDLLNLADALNKIPDAERRLVIESGVFGKGLATGFDAFLREGSSGIKELEQLFVATGGVLSKEELNIADKAKIAFALLDASVTGLKNHIGLALAPAIGTLATGLSQLIAQNVDAVRQFVLELSNKAIPVIKDFVLALSGRRGEVQNQAVLEFIDQVDQLRQHLLAIVGVAGTVFKGLQVAADIAAGAIKFLSLGFVNLSGNTLLAVLSVGKFLGIGKAIGSVFSLGAALVRNFAAAIGVATTAFTFLRAASLFLLATPLGVAITAVVAALALLATGHSLAGKAADEHKRSVGELQQALADLKAGMLDSAGFDKIAKDHLAAAQAALTDAKAQLEAMRAIARASVEAEIGVGVSLGDLSAEEQKSLQPAIERDQRLADALAGVAEQQKRVADLQSVIDDKNKLVGKSFDQVGAAVETVVQKFGVLHTVADAATASIKASGAAAEQTFGAVRHNADAAASAVAVSFEDNAKNLKAQLDAAKAAGADADTLFKKNVEGLKAQLEAEKAAGNDAEGSFRRNVEGLAASIKAGATATGDVVSKVKAGVGSLAAAAAPAASAITAVGTAAAKAGTKAEGAASGFDTIKTAAVSAFEDLQAKGQDAAAAIAATFADMVDGVQAMFGDLDGAIGNIFGAIADLIAQVGGQVQAAIAGIIASLSTAVAQAQQLAAAAAQAASEAASAGAGIGGHAAGGPIFGPGSGTSDSILARLSNGEFVLSARAVRHWGVGFLAAMNSLRLTREDLRGFSLGGIVDQIGASFSAGLPRFAAGGTVFAGAGSASVRTVRLEFQLGDQVFVAQTDEQTVAGLSRAAARERMLSIGSPARRIAR